MDSDAVDESSLSLSRSGGCALAAGKKRAHLHESLGRSCAATTIYTVMTNHNSKILLHSQEHPLSV